MTVANALTILRLLLIPVFVDAVWYESHGVAFWVFSVAGLTDLLDGALARWLHQRSRLGEYLDPAADKFLLVSAFLVLSIPSIHLRHHMPVWLMTMVIARDVIIVTSAAVIHLTTGNVRFKPTWLGKASTGTQVATIFVLLAMNYLDRDSILVPTALAATFLATFASGVHYMFRARALVETPTLRVGESKDGAKQG
ncbi:MAG: CDP-alcohol phosphatidyltransferase family protein [Acidobacteriota bacterium]